MTLFAFDDVSLPFLKNLKVTLERAEKYEDKPVLRRGESARLYAVYLSCGIWWIKLRDSQACAVGSTANPSVAAVRPIQRRSRCALSSRKTMRR